CAPSTTALRATVPLPRSALLHGAGTNAAAPLHLFLPRAAGEGDRPAQPGGGGGAGRPTDLCRRRGPLEPDLDLLARQRRPVGDDVAGRRGGAGGDADGGAVAGDEAVLGALQPRFDIAARGGDDPLGV